MHTIIQLVHGLLSVVIGPLLGVSVNVLGILIVLGLKVKV